MDNKFIEAKFIVGDGGDKPSFSENNGIVSRGLGIELEVVELSSKAPNVLVV